MTFTSTFLKTTAITTFTTALLGCGGVSLPTENQAALCPNIDQAVLATSNYSVSDNINRSYAFSLLQAIQLSSADTALSASTKLEVTDALTKINEIVNKFIHYSPKEKGGDITNIENIKSVTNELDLMESLIVGGSLGNINEGRQSIRTIINSNQLCKYDNNQIEIKNLANENEKRYYTIRYNYSPAIKNTNGNTVSLLTKILASSKLQQSPGSETTTQQFTAISVTKLNPESFSASGYNNPLFLNARFGDNKESIIIEDDFENKTGSIEYITSTTFSLNTAKTAVKRLRLDVDYASSQVDIFASSFLVQYQKKDGTLITDPTDIEFQALQDETGGKNRDGTFNYTQVFDTAYNNKNGNIPTPIYTYAASPVASRQ